MDIDTHS